MCGAAVAVAGPNNTSASVHRGRRRRILSPLLPSCLLFLALLVLLETSTRRHGAHAFRIIHAGCVRSVKMAAATAAAGPGSEERVVVYVFFLSVAALVSFPHPGRP